MPQWPCGYENYQVLSMSSNQSYNLGDFYSALWWKIDSLTIGSRCNSASPVRDPTARLMQNWMHNWNTLVQEVHSRITMPNMDVRVITTLAIVA